MHGLIVRVITNFNDSNEGGQLEFTETSEQKTTDRITKTPENIRALCRDIKCSLLFMEITIYIMTYFLILTMDSTGII